MVAILETPQIAVF